jgi:hypothetical protein
MKSYWVSTTFITGRVDVNEQGIITLTPPVWARWYGAPFENFRLAHQGHDMRVRLMNEDKN